MGEEEVAEDGRLGSRRRFLSILSSNARFAIKVGVPWDATDLAKMATRVHHPILKSGIASAADAVRAI